MIELRSYPVDDEGRSEDVGHKNGNGNDCSGKLGHLQNVITLCFEIFPCIAKFNQ